MVKGTVTDETNQPVAGVNVVEQGTTNGTITDMNGNYSLEVSGPNAILQYSFIGSRTITQKVGNQTSINVVLQEDSQALSEVVVVGFGTQKKVNLTGSVSTVASKALESRPVANVSQALQGLVPGLNFSYAGSGNGGELNNDMKLNIRGGGTIGDGSKSSPLVLIDGMEGDMNALNPQDIESVSVLKDAAASSIYGSRAPFGVILITTKKGSAGKISVNYNNSFRWSSAINTPDIADSYTYAQYFNRAAENMGEPDVLHRNGLNALRHIRKERIFRQPYRILITRPVGIGREIPITTGTISILIMPRFHRNMPSVPMGEVRNINSMCLPIIWTRAVCSNLIRIRCNVIPLPVKSMLSRQIG